MKYIARVFAEADEAIQQFELDAGSLPEAAFLAAVAATDDSDARRIEVAEVS